MKSYKNKKALSIIFLLFFNYIFVSYSHANIVCENGKTNIISGPLFSLMKKTSCEDYFQEDFNGIKLSRLSVNRNAIDACLCIKRNPFKMRSGVNNNIYMYHAKNVQRSYNSNITKRLPDIINKFLVLGVKLPTKCSAESFSERFINSDVCLEKDIKNKLNDRVFDKLKDLKIIRRDDKLKDVLGDFYELFTKELVRKINEKSEQQEIDIYNETITSVKEFLSGKDSSAELKNFSDDVVKKINDIFAHKKTLSSFINSIKKEKDSDDFDTANFMSTFFKKNIDSKCERLNRAVETFCKFHPEHKVGKYKPKLTIDFINQTKDILSLSPNFKHSRGKVDITDEVKYSVYKYGSNLQCNLFKKEITGKLKSCNKAPNGIKCTEAQNQLAQLSESKSNALGVDINEAYSNIKSSLSNLVGSKLLNQIPKFDINELTSKFSELNPFKNISISTAEKIDNSIKKETIDEMKKTIDYTKTNDYKNPTAKNTLGDYNSNHISAKISAKVKEYDVFRKNDNSLSTFKIISDYSRPNAIAGIIDSPARPSSAFTDSQAGKSAVTPKATHIPRINPKNTFNNSSMANIFNPQPIYNDEIKNSFIKNNEKPNKVKKRFSKKKYSNTYVSPLRNKPQDSSIKTLSLELEKLKKELSVIKKEKEKIDMQKKLSKKKKKQKSKKDRDQVLNSKRVISSISSPRQVSFDSNINTRNNYNKPTTSNNSYDVTTNYNNQRTSNNSSYQYVKAPNTQMSEATGNNLIQQNQSSFSLISNEDFNETNFDDSQNQVFVEKNGHVEVWAIDIKQYKKEGTKKYKLIKTIKKSEFDKLDLDNIVFKNKIEKGLKENNKIITPYRKSKITHKNLINQLERFKD